MIFLRKFLKKSVNSMCLSCLWPFTKYPFVFFSRKYLRSGYGNKRRESWIQACSKPKTYTRSNIGLSQVRTCVPIIYLEICCIELHWILNNTFQSFTKLLTDFSSILILSLELVSYGWGQWNLDEEARWLSHLHLKSKLFNRTSAIKSYHLQLFFIRESLRLSMLPSDCWTRTTWGRTLSSKN